MSPNISVHIDVEGDIKKEEAKPTTPGAVRPGPQGPDAVVNELPTDLGPQQVEALLEYQLDEWMEKSLADAEDDADAIYHLEQHRILGNKKTN